MLTDNDLTIIEARARLYTQPGDDEERQRNALAFWRQAAADVLELVTEIRRARTPVSGEPTRAERLAAFQRHKDHWVRLIDDNLVIHVNDIAEYAGMPVLYVVLGPLTAGLTLKELREQHQGMIHSVYRSRPDWQQLNLILTEADWAELLERADYQTSRDLPGWPEPASSSNQVQLTLL